MGPFSMVVAIITVLTIGRIIIATIKSRGERPLADHPDTLRMREEVKVLKERVAVLERVITDTEDSVRLDREIARLRTDNQA